MGVRDSEIAPTDSRVAQSGIRDTGKERQMIFRISNKLGKKIRMTPDEVLPVDPNPFADWSANLFTVDRTQYVLVTNTISLYSMVMLGRGLKDERSFRKGVADRMRDVMRSDGHESTFERFIVPSMDSVHFSKALNRSVIGSMNELMGIAKFCMTAGEQSPFEVSFRLNGTIMSYLNHGTPEDVLQELANNRGD